MRVASWLVVAIAASAGCQRTHAAADAGLPDAGVPDSALPVEIPMQIVVTDGEVQVFMDGLDRGSCDCTPLPFPTASSCSVETDASSCSDDPYCPSCITDIGVEVDGQRLTPAGDHGDDPWDRTYGTFPSGALSLVIAGCGHPSTRISLDGPAFPQATATADFVDGMPHVSWTTDVPAASTLLSLAAENAGELCLAQGGSSYVFDNWMFGSNVEVEPLASRTDVVTSFGPATIWRAGSVWATFPMTP